MKIAYVDNDTDVADFRDTITGYLPEDEVTFFYSADAAAVSLLHARYDAVVTELFMLPGDMFKDEADVQGRKTGYRLLQRLRQDDSANKDTPFFIHTVYSNERGAEWSAEYGLEDVSHIQKPDFSGLVERLKRLEAAA